MLSNDIEDLNIAVVDEVDEDDDKIVDIPLKDRKPNLEKDVDYFMSIIDPLPKNTIKHTRVEIPTSFKNTKVQEQWEDEEIRRCKEGHNGMCGKMYFWYHYGCIVSVEDGKISPEYRVADNEWFKNLEWARDSKGWGLVCVKRRRAGFSWKAASDALHDAMFYPFSLIGLNSKTETDSKILFKKVRFLYDNAPFFLRAKIGRKTAEQWWFHDTDKDDHGNNIIVGTQSEMAVKAPTVSAFEGWALSKWVCDEAGKQKDLMQMWSFTEDCMMVETRRIGVPIIFGTSGEVDKNGAGLLELWTNSEIYKLKRFFFGAWMGLHCDEFGNDQIEFCLRWVIYERDRRSKLSAKQYNDFLQKYPLTIKEAFTISAQGGVGDPMKVNNQISSLRDNPASAERGFMEMTKEGVIFVPDKNGSIIVWERPDEALNKNSYLSGSDPADHDYEGVPSPEVSKLSSWIMKKRQGTVPPRIVAEYTDRPEKASEFYNQTALLQMWYHQCKILIERNRYRMIAWYDENGYKFLMNRTPTTITRMFGKKPASIGVHMTEAIREYMEDSIIDYIDEYSEYIPSIELLEECLVYGAQNTDRVYGWGMCLMQLAEERKKATTSRGGNSSLPTWSYRKDRSGRVVRVDTKYNKV